MADEKSVIIPYDRWNSHYKRIEETLIKTLAELQDERERKVIRLEYRLSRAYFDMPGVRHFNSEFYTGNKTLTVATLELDTSPEDSEIKLQFSKFDANSIELFLEDVKHHIKRSCNAYGLLLDARDVKAQMARLSRTANELDIKIKAVADINHKISKIPKVIRWLFGIKLIK